MRHFEICNPTLQVSNITEEMKLILATQLKIKIKVNNIEQTSHVMSQTLNQTKITWGQRFSFQNISEGFDNVFMSLIQNQGNVIVQCNGNLIFSQNQQLFETQWKNNKISIKFLLIEHGSTDRNNEKQKQMNQNNNQILKQHVINNGNQDIVPSSEQYKQQQHHQNKKQIDRQFQNTLEQNDNQLQLADKYALEKEKAKKLAQQQIRNVQQKVISNIEQIKSKISSNSFTPKQSKLGTQRNKQNQSILHSSIRVPFDKNEDLTTNYSPKDSIIKSQSFTSSMMKENISQRKKFGDKIFENQSATTMQKSILNFSIPKGPRFNDIKYNGTQPQYNVCGSFVSKNKGTSFGFGIRKPYPQWMVKNMKQYPAPNCYTVSHSPSQIQPISSISKGKSFGLSYKYYQKAVVNAKTNSRSKNIQLPKISKHQVPTKNCAFENHYHYKS